MAEKPLGNLDLGKKIGPFSIGVWLIVGAGGVGLAYVLNRTVLGGGSGTATAVEPGVGGTPGGFIPAPRPGEEPEEPEEPEEESRILDNEMWAFAATTYLVTQGYNAVNVGVAIRKYLDGEMISSSDATMIQMAVNELGPPPTIPVGGGIIQPKPEPEPEPEPKPAPKPTPAPKAEPKPKPKVKTATVSKGKYVTVTPWPTKKSTLWGIAEVEYGDGTKWTRIWNHSINENLRRKRGRPELIRPGDRFWVPK